MTLRVERQTHLLNGTICPSLNYTTTPLNRVPFHAQITNNSGITFVCSAGNDASTTSTYAPAGWSDDNIISVGGSAGNDIRAFGSNYNQTTVDLFAPSGLFLSGYSGDFVTCGGIYPECDWTMNSLDLSKVSYGIFTTTINGGYTNMFSGTSAAAPHVTGAVALVSKYFNTTSPSEIKSRILNSVDVKNSLDNYCVTEGRLNLRRALSVFSDMATANGWRDVQGAPNCLDFGWVDDNDYPWIYHLNLGLLYVQHTANPSTLWLYHPTHGWMMTSDTYYTSFHISATDEWKSMSEL